MTVAIAMVIAIFTIISFLKIAIVINLIVDFKASIIISLIAITMMIEKQLIVSITTDLSLNFTIAITIISFNFISIVNLIMFIRLYLAFIMLLMILIN